MRPLDLQTVNQVAIDNQLTSENRQIIECTGFASSSSDNLPIDIKALNAVDGVHECSSELAILAAFSLIQQLRPWLKTPDQWGATYKRQHESGYRLLLAFRDGVPRALAGFRIQENLIHRKFLYVDDLVSDSNMRSAGLGTALIQELERVARHANCDHLVLDTGITNHNAQRFYKRCGMSALALRFVSPIVPNNELT